MEAQEEPKGKTAMKGKGGPPGLSPLRQDFSRQSGGAAGPREQWPKATQGGILGLRQFR
jgi:hypothetical protein